MSAPTDTQIDPQAVISDLLEQMKRLTLENAMLRVYINKINPTATGVDLSDTASESLVLPDDL